jgi:hypothetical protein
VIRGSARGRPDLLAGAARVRLNRELLAARWVLGLARGDDLQQAADRALTEGTYGPVLAELASMRSPTMSDVVPLAEQAFAELGTALPTVDDATRLVAVEHARAILDGSCTPYEGARRIAVEATSRIRMRGDHSLDAFLYWEDEYVDADDDERRAHCEQAIRQAARELVTGGAGADCAPFQT